VTAATLPAAGGEPDNLTTYQAVTLALYLEGGELRPVDTEDIAMRVNALLPGRFTWRKFPDQIDLNSVMISLRHAKRVQNGKLVAGDASSGWRLTDSGVESARAVMHQVGQHSAQDPARTRAEARWARLERNRLLAEAAFVKFKAGETSAITLGDAEKFFRLDDYIQGDRRATFVTRICSVFGRDPELASAVSAIRLVLEGGVR
jgi:hypothetical protein